MIQSRDNPRYKRLQRIAQGKRPVGGGEQQLWLEGVHLCQSWIERFGEPESVVVDAEALASDAEIQQLLAEATQAEQLVLDRRLFKALSSVERPQGIAFVVSPPTPMQQQGLRDDAVLLDRIQDPGNLGTMLRTAAAAGITQVYLSKGCVAAWSQKVLRSAQGAHFHLNIYEQVDLPRLMSDATIPVYATALHQARSLYDIEIPTRAAWVFGNEGQGVDPALLNLVAQKVFIPQSEKVESLNVAIAAGICLFEQQRQRLAFTRTKP